MIIYSFTGENNTVRDLSTQMSTANITTTMTVSSTIGTTASTTHYDSTLSPLPHSSFPPKVTDFYVHYDYYPAPRGRYVAVRAPGPTSKYFKKIFLFNFEDRHTLLSVVLINIL